ncbi:MAG: alpha/beta hydrolase [bacterium]|nr:alpha/beta hydrolase [bacterium]
MTEKEPRGNPKSFDEQFNCPEKKEIYGGQLEIYDVSPEKAKTDVPVIVAPGWAANAAVFKDNMRELADRERRAISFGNYHGIENNLANTENIPNVEWRKVAALIGTIEAQNLDKVDVVAHSEGAIYTLLAANIYPEKFRNIVLVDPAGFIEDDSWPKLTARFAKDLGTQYLRSVLNGKAYRPALGRVGRARIQNIDSPEKIKIPKVAQAIKHLGPQPTLKKSVQAGYHFNKAATQPLATLREIFAIGAQDLIDTLEELQNKGVNVSILHAASDSAFPISQVKKATQGKIKQFKTRPGSHNEIYLNAGRYTRAAERMLTAMEASNSPVYSKLKSNIEKYHKPSEKLKALIGAFDLAVFPNEPYELSITNSPKKPWQENDEVRLSGYGKPGNKQWIYEINTALDDKQEISFDALIGMAIHEVRHRAQRELNIDLALDMESFATAMDKYPLLKQYKESVLANEERRIKSAPQSLPLHIEQQEFDARVVEIIGTAVFKSGLSIQEIANGIIKLDAEKILDNINKSQA